MPKIRIYGSCEAYLCGNVVKAPFCEDVEEDGTRGKYVEFDFTVDVANEHQAQRLASFISAFSGTTDGGFRADILRGNNDGN